MGGRMSHSKNTCWSEVDPVVSIFHVMSYSEFEYVANIGKGAYKDLEFDWSLMASSSTIPTRTWLSRVLSNDC